MADKQWGHAVIAQFGRCWGCASQYRTFTQISGIKTHSISSLVFVSYYMLDFFLAQQSLSPVMSRSRHSALGSFQVC